MSKENKVPRRDNPTCALPHKEEPRKIVPYRVFVAGLPNDIVVYSASKSESVAVGEYGGEHVRGSGANALNAAEAWAKAAKALSELRDPASSPRKRNGVYVRRSNRRRKVFRRVGSLNSAEQPREECLVCRLRFG
jgi:hypothetical protein